MHKVLLDILVCPVTKAPLTLNAEGTELISTLSGMAYPVRDGIPVLLETEARTLNAEERLNSGFVQ